MSLESFQRQFAAWCDYRQLTDAEPFFLTPEDMYGTLDDQEEFFGGPVNCDFTATLFYDEDSRLCEILSLEGDAKLFDEFRELAKKHGFRICVTGLCVELLETQGVSVGKSQSGRTNRTSYPRR